MELGSWEVASHSTKGHMGRLSVFCHLNTRVDVASFLLKLRCDTCLKFTEVMSLKYNFSFLLISWFMVFPFLGETCIIRQQAKMLPVARTLPRWPFNCGPHQGGPPSELNGKDRPQRYGRGNGLAYTRRKFLQDSLGQLLEVGKLGTEKNGKNQTSLILGDDKKVQTVTVPGELGLYPLG